MSSRNVSGASDAQALAGGTMQSGPGLPNTRFDGYSQDEIYGMFQQDADPGAVQSQPPKR